MDYIIILLIVNVFAAVAVIALTLIQQPKGDMGSAFGGGGSQSMFGSRGSANFLTKSTSWMCFVFFASSLMLAYMYAQKNSDTGIVDESVIEEVSDLPEIVDATDANQNEESSLPALPVDGAVEAVEQTVNDGASAVEGALESATETVDDAIEEAKETE